MHETYEKPSLLGDASKVLVDIDALTSIFLFHFTSSDLER